MKRKLNWLIAIAVLMALAVTLCACKPTTEGPTVTAIYDVSQGTTAVASALNKVIDLSDKDSVYITAQFVQDDGADSTDILYDLAAVLNQKNDAKCRLSYTKRNDVGQLLLEEIYYKDSTLYVNKPPVFDKAAIKDVSMARVASTLVASAKDGQLKFLWGMLPALGNRLFASCERVEQDNAVTYTFAVDNSAIGATIHYLYEQIGLLSEAEWTRLLGGDMDSEAQINWIFTTQAQEDGEVFVSASRVVTVGDSRTSLTLRSFACKSLDETTAAQTKIAIPDGISAFTPYHWGNLSLDGTVSVTVASSTNHTHLGAQNLVSSLSTAQYNYDISLHSNVSDGGAWQALLTLTNQDDRSRMVQLYYADNTLWADLSAFGLGQWRMPAAELQTILASVGQEQALQSLSAADYRDIVLDLLVDRTPATDEVTYAVGAATVNKLLAQIQQLLSQNVLHSLPVLDINGVQVYINTQNSRFKSLRATVAIPGISVQLNVDDPGIGTAVSVTQPAWCEACLNPTQQATLTPVISGVITSNTLADNNTALLKAFLASVSGETVDLGVDKIYYYHLAANISGKGDIRAVSVDFDSVSNARICSLYYCADSADRLFVIMPDGSTKTLLLVQENRFVDFVRAINGNTDRKEMQECLVTNSPVSGDQGGSVTVTWSESGFNALLARIYAALGASDEQTARVLPADLGIQGVRVTVGSKRSVRLIFADDRYIEFSVEQIAIGQESLALVGDEKWSDVSYFDAYNLPASVKVKLGDGSAQPRSLTVPLADMGTQWQFETIPSLGEGKYMVTAYCTIFGQKMSVKYTVDCTAPTVVRVDPVDDYASRLSNRVFTFARYGEVGLPQEVLRAYNTVTVTLNGKNRTLSLIWLHNGTPVAQAKFASPKQNGTDSDYALIPAVINHFGQTVALDVYLSEAGKAVTLAGEYTLRLSGNSITSLRNANNYLTLQTYGNTPYDPFDEATYNRVTPVFYESGTSIYDGAVTYRWDIDSIANKAIGDGGFRDGSKALSHDEMLNTMRTALYSMSGKYAIDLLVFNSLGMVEHRLNATVTVEPYVIQSVEFAKLPDGVTYRKVDNQAYKGVFEVAAITRTSLGAAFVFAKEATVTFVDKEQKLPFDAKDWTVEPVAAINMFKAYEGDVIVALGDSAGGKQNITLRYKVAAQPVDAVALWGWRNGEKVLMDGSKQAADADTSAYTFVFTAQNDALLNPYDYVHPAGLAVCKGNNVEMIEQEFHFAGWSPNTLWHKTDVVYTATETVYNVSVTVQMQFAEKRKQSWQFAGYTDAEDGAFVYVDGEWVAYDADKHSGMTRFAPLAEQTVTYAPGTAGAYVLIEDKYERFDRNNPEHSGLQRYTRDVLVATPYLYVEDDDGEWVVQNGTHVAYDSSNSAHQSLTRYSREGTVVVVYREGTDNLSRLIMDPNAVDYTCTDMYPKWVVVTFTDNTSAVLPAVWDLSQLQGVRPEEGYINTVGLSLDMGQALDEVSMRIESTRPDRAYCTVSTDEHGQVLVDGDGHAVGTNTIELRLLTVADGQLVVHDLSSQKELHALICGCSDADCLGKMYFDYGEATPQNAFFPITEWKKLDTVAARIAEALAKDGAPKLQELSLRIEVIAVARNIENTIVLNIMPSQMDNVQYPVNSMPLANSSLASGGNNVYSMAADGTALTVDPYVADVKDAGSYPFMLQMTLGGEACTTRIDQWDLSALSAIIPYEGASKTVYALLHTNYGDVRIEAPITVKRRVVQTLFVDGSDNRFVYVNAYATSPFGKELVVENGRTLACKNVQVRFENDDLKYPMIMRYDITDYIAPYNSTRLSTTPISVWVGNDAGGYQTLTNYQVYTVANDVLRIVCPEDDAAYDDLKAYLQDEGGNWSGVLFENERFVTFDDSTEANVAWRALTTKNQKLVLGCGYRDESGVLRLTDYVVTVADAGALGLHYRWQRAVFEGKEELRLSVWNTCAFGNDHLQTQQSVGTGTNRYIALQRNMLNIVSVVDQQLALTYNADRTVQKLLSDHAVSVSGEEIFSKEELTSQVYAAADALFASPLEPNFALTVGDYVWRIAIDSEYYKGSLNIDVTVSPVVLNNVVVKIGNNEETVKNSDLLAGYEFSSSQFWKISATAGDQELEIRYWRDDVLQTGIENSGTYTVQLVSKDANCQVDLGGGKDSFTLTFVSE